MLSLVVMKATSSTRSSRRFRPHAIVALAIGLALATTGFVLASNQLAPSPQLNSLPIELEKIKSTNIVSVQSQWYLKLIERVGPEEAQEILWDSDLPRTGNTHLLNHISGDYLFEKFGPGGIVKCQNYFSASCYHGIVIKTVGSGQLDRIGELMESCQQAGFSAPRKCSHALGHGFVAALDYPNLFKALDLCDQVTNQNIPGYQGSQCLVGAFMENIWGIHEGTPSPNRLIKADDNFYPCNDARMKDHYMKACWFNQAFQMNKVFRGDLVKVASECTMLDVQEHRQACLDGAFRALSSRTNNNVSEKFANCQRMPKPYILTCLTTNAQAAYQQGDNTTPIKICDRIPSSDQNVCYERLYRVVIVESSPQERQDFCTVKVPSHRRDQCLKATKA
jgi:hypothetical protein